MRARFSTYFRWVNFQCECSETLLFESTSVPIDVQREKTLDDVIRLNEEFQHVGRRAKIGESMSNASGCGSSKCENKNKGK
jgi:hypothetical protein